MLSKELKAQNDIAKDQYKFFQDQMNVNKNNRRKDKSDEDISNEVKSDESRTAKEFDGLLKDLRIMVGLVN